MTAAARVRMAGPLTRYVEGFAAELTAHGYTDLSLANQLRLMAHLSRWLQAHGTPVDAIDRQVVGRFLSARRRTHTQFITERALAPLLRHLQRTGVVSMADPDRRPQGELLCEYENYLVEERAVLPARRDLCLAVAAEFLAGKRAGALKAKDVTGFVDARVGRPGLVECVERAAIDVALPGCHREDPAQSGLRRARHAAMEIGLAPQVPRAERACGRICDV